MRFLPQRLHRLIAAREGATSIEFAVVAPILILIMFGTIELSLVMMTQGLMESATFNASRLGKTGFIPTGVTREQAIRDLITQRTGSLIDPNEIAITAQSYGAFTQVNEPEPYTDSNHNGYHDAGEPFVDSNGNATWDADMGLAGLGNAGDIVLYTITYPWNLKTPIMSQIAGNDGIMELTVRAIIKNEPY